MNFSTIKNRLTEFANRNLNNSTAQRPRSGLSVSAFLLESLERRQFCSATISTPAPVASPSDYGILVGNFPKSVPGGWLPGELNYNPAQEIVARLENPVTHDHVDTADTNETNALVSGGWVFEGFQIHWYSQPTGASNLMPMHRLYNPTLQQHLFTTDANENAVLIKSGWNLEEIAGYVSTIKTTDASAPVYRLSDPVSGAHLITSDANEYNVLTQTPNWMAEGIVGYVDSYT